MSAAPVSNNISIILDNPSGVYAPGSILSGTVIVFLTKAKKSRWITLHAYGHAKTSFSKSHFDGSKTESIRYSSQKSYLDYCIPVWKPSKGDKEELQPGQHCFKFSCGIPWNALPNFEGQYGHIRYNIKAEMHLSWHFNLSCEKRFAVLSILEPTPYNQPVKGFISQTGTFSSSKVVKAEITLPKKIYTCGEDILITVTIDNQSGTSIESIETGIQTEACYFGETSFSVCSKRKDEHECFTSFTRTDTVHIPDGAREQYRRTLGVYKQLPTITECPIIIVKHFVYVKIYKKGIFSSTVSQSIPIILTTARLEPANQLPPKLVIPSAPEYNEEDALVNSIRASSRDLRSNSGSNLYPSTSSFRPSSVPDDFTLTEAFGAPPAYTEIDNNTSGSHPAASAPPPPEYYVEKL